LALLTLHRLLLHAVHWCCPLALLLLLLLLLG
jgi:hypothetical protein